MVWVNNRRFIIHTWASEEKKEKKEKVDINQSNFTKVYVQPEGGHLY